MLRGLIFDVDDTLVYYEGYDMKRWYEEVARPAMEKLGVVLDLDTFVKIVRGGLSRRYVERFGIDHVEFWKALDIANGEYRRKLIREGKIRPFPDVDALGELRNLGLKLAAVSNASLENIYLVLKPFGLEKYFDLILGKDYSYLDGAKPSPYLVEKAMNALGLKRDEVLMVGDSSNDILAAKNAGIKSVNLTRLGKVEGADYYVRDLRELVELVKRMLGDQSP